MFRASLTLLAVALLALPLPAQPKSRADLDARAALALHASASHATVAVATPQPRGLSYADAVAYTHLTHRPVMVSVSMDCSSLCSKLAGAIPATHVKDLAGDTSPHLRLIVADAAGRLWGSGERWTTLPTEGEVKTAAAKLARHVASPEAGAHTPTAPAASDAASPGGFGVFRR